MIINRIYEHQSLLSLYLLSFLVGLRTYQHPLSRTKTGPYMETENVNCEPAVIHTVRRGGI